MMLCKFIMFFPMFEKNLFLYGIKIPKKSIKIPIRHLSNTYREMNEVGTKNHH